MKRLMWYLNVFGLQGLLLAFFAVINNRSVAVKIYSNKLKSWVVLRTKTSDLSVYEKVVKNEEYALPDAVKPEVIVDAGANIGISTLYFATKYPNAKIVAIEPDESNYNQLKTNTSKCKSVYTIKAALWDRNETVNLCGEKNSDFKVEAGEDGFNVSGMTVDELMKKFDLNYIDIMKVDIEGSEKEVFESSEGWINNVGAIVIELHDRFKPGCSDALKMATTNFVSRWTDGENTFFMRDVYEK